MTRGKSSKIEKQLHELLVACSLSFVHRLLFQL